MVEVHDFHWEVNFSGSAEVYHLLRLPWAVRLMGA